MQRFPTAVLFLTFTIALTAGCGKSDGLLRTQGRLLQSGQALIPKAGEFVQVVFVPIMPEGQVPSDHYVALVDQAAGTFVPAGKNRKGMPPGKYRVAVELLQNRKDQFGGKFDTVQSPFVVDVDPTTQEIVIDLDNPPTTS
jgi:hypothetical protein